MMLILKTAVVVVFMLGCDRSQKPEDKTTQTQGGTASHTNRNTVRTVTFRSHLDGDIDDDPVVRCGETITVTPDSSEPTEKHDAVVVSLPESTPFQDIKQELYFLRGFAVGQLSAVNHQFAAHSNGSEARQHDSWNAGWEAGFRDRTSR